MFPGPILLIMEFAQYGSLRSFMHKSRAQIASSSESLCLLNWQSPCDSFYLGDVDLDQGMMAEYQVTKKDILSFAWQVARGMDYLSKKKVRKLFSRIEEI